MLTEHLNSQYQIASSLRRLLAVIVDLIWVLLLARFVLWPLFLPQNWDIQAQLHGSFGWAYGLACVLFLMKDCFGYSLGKALFNLKIVLVQPNFPKPRFKKLIQRNIFLFVLPIELYLLVFGKHSRRLGDKKYGTVVVHHNQPWHVRRLTHRVISGLAISGFLWLGYTWMTNWQIKKSYVFQAALQQIKELPEAENWANPSFWVDFYTEENWQWLAFKLTDESTDSKKPDSKNTESKKPESKNLIAVKFAWEGWPTKPMVWKKIEIENTAPTPD